MNNHSVRQKMQQTESIVPDKVTWYVPDKNHSTLSRIIESGHFMPVYITGQTGNGKTMMVAQACAQARREMVRVNVTIETDEDSLLGGFRLVNGDTAWQDGPVVTAMKNGSILLLDEVDLGANKLMCLQPVMEGGAVLLKRTGELVRPAPGFNIVATANTKGRGSDDGKYIGTNVMNEAFLDRFSITLEQAYPSDKAEIRILKTQFKNTAMTEELIKKLVAWANQIRSTYDSGAIEDNISTRRLVQICSLHTVLSDKPIKEAMGYCMSRMSPESKMAMLETWDKMDSGVEPTKAKQGKDWKNPDEVITF